MGHEVLFDELYSAYMIDYDQILLPTGGSEASQRAIAYAVGTAARHGATLHALHVVDAGPDSTQGTSGGLSMD